MNRKHLALATHGWLASALLLLVLAGCESGGAGPSNNGTPTPTPTPTTAQLDAWVGAEASELTLRLSDNLSGAEFYASSDLDCNFDNYGVCDNPNLHLNVTNGSRFSGDTATTLAHPGSYQLRQGDLRADAILSAEGFFDSSDQRDEAKAAQQTTGAEFSVREGYAVVVYDDGSGQGDQLWLIGGSDDDGDKNDVWSSKDGITWTQKTAAAEFPARRYHQVVVFDDGLGEGEKLWLIGGVGGGGRDVWSSKDGITWTQKTAAAEFPEHEVGLQVVVFDDGLADGDKLWLIGGAYIDGPYNDDVWSSKDGITWTQKTLAVESRFTPRYEHQVVVFDDGGGDGEQLWLFGGNDVNFRLGDVWSSKDGVNWTPKTADAELLARQRHQVVVYDDGSGDGNQLWLIGGYDVDDSRKNDVWSSKDGITWTQKTLAAEFSARDRHQVVVFDDGSGQGDALLLVGGIVGVPANAKANNEVWRSRNGEAWQLGLKSRFTVQPD